MTKDNEADPFEVLRSMDSAMDGAEGLANDTVRRALEAVRLHMGMQVAYVSEFVDGRTYFREVDAPGYEAIIQRGGSMSMSIARTSAIVFGSERP